MIRYLILCLLFLSFVHSNGQNVVNGKVFDIDTKEPLAFANIVFNDNPQMQTTSDIDGKFSYNAKKEINKLSCSFVGYEKKMFPISRPSENISVALASLGSMIEEVIVDGPNPARRIMRKVIDNKKINNPEHLSSFKYRSYNKTVYDFKANGKEKSDSLKIRRTLKGGHLLLMESITERKFSKPDHSTETVLATRVSGFKNPSFAALATDIQPFSFYQDNIRLLNIYYLNPISNGSLNKYRYRLEETILKGKDTVFVISFEPLRNKNFDGLKGLLYINSNQYAIQNVTAVPAQKGKISLKIQQQYQFLEDKYWFPEQLNYNLILEEYPSEKVGVTANGKSYITNVEINLPLHKKTFPAETTTIAEDASKKDSVFWNNIRREKLSVSEIKTYHIIDSIGVKDHYDRYLTALEKLAVNKVSISFVDIDLQKTLLVNQHEAIRLGTGIYTNNKVFQDVTLGGFFGYGLKDEKWKYGAEVQYHPGTKKDFAIGIRHQNNLIEIGGAGMRLYDQKLFNFRSFMGSRFDQVTQNSIVLQFRTLKYFSWHILMNQTAVIPRYNEGYQSNISILRKYNYTDLSIYLRFAFKEKRAQSFGTTFGAGTKYPVVYLFYSRAIKNLIEGDIDYNKIEVAVDYTAYTKNIGRTGFRVEGGYIDKAPPVGLLFTGEGGYSEKLPYFSRNTFQTMLPYEFLSDRYANLFLSHNFGSLLFKLKNFQPDISAHHNMGWGRFNNISQPQNVSYNTKENVYFENGLQFDNILKLNFQNLGYLGAGVGVFYRYGSYSSPSVEENIAYKFSLRYSIK